MPSKPSTAPSGPSESLVLDKEVIVKLEALTPNAICSGNDSKRCFVGMPYAVVVYCSDNSSLRKNIAQDLNSVSMNIIFADPLNPSGDTRIVVALKDGRDESARFYLEDIQIMD